MIPVKSISEISMPKSFNGKSVLAPLLSVRFNFGDREDEIAWVVKDPGAWKKTIEQVGRERPL